MNETEAGEQLDLLLERAASRGADESAWFDGSSPVAIFGAGTLGREVATKLRRCGIEPAVFIDETPGKAGTVIDGVPVHDLSTGAARFASAVVAVAIWNPHHRFVDSRARLERAGFSRVASFIHAAYAFPETFLPHYAFDVPQATLAHAKELHEALAVFDDDQSRDEFLRHVAFRLTLDFAALPANSPEKYFRSEFPHSLKPDTILVDCGAFNGDTITDFVRATGGVFRAIVALEPQPENFAALTATVNGLDAAMRTRIRLLQAAVAERSGTAQLQLVAGEGSFLADSGGTTVNTISLDDLLAGEEGALFLKFDIEGAECAALRGARGTLRRTPRPSLAVSAYHCAADLWRIPLTIRDHGGYRQYLRTEGDDGMGIVSYAF